MSPRTRSLRSSQRGAALLLAMLILSLVTTLAAGMVWQQWRAVQVEAAERARTQSAWILAGALDWARLILREDARNGGPDHLGEPWAVPLAEARLSSFLAADRDNNSSDEPDGVEAFLAGSITDAQARWNLRRLVTPQGSIDPAELRVLQRLCERAGLATDVADRIAVAMRRAFAPVLGAPGAPAAAAAGAGGAAGVAGAASAVSGVPASEQAIAPQRLSELAWLGIDAAALRSLEAWVTLLPGADATVNVNTAPAEVIAAAVDGMSLANAQRLVLERQRTPLRDPKQPPGRAYFPADPATSLAGVGASSRYFIVQGRLRLGDRVLEERSLVERRQLEMIVLSRERVNLRDAP